MMRIAKVDAVCKIWPFSSILFRLFAFSLSMSVQPCYNPIEIKSKPPRRFLAKMKKPRGRAFLEEPS
jgi:hypothetical protein